MSAMYGRNDFPIREPTDEEVKIVDETIREFMSLEASRAGYIPLWTDTAALIWPEVRHTFVYGNASVHGEKRAELQVDSTGMAALAKFGAVCDSLLSPQNQIWHELEVDPYLMKQRGVRLWLQESNHVLFKERYNWRSGYVGQNQAVWKYLGAFGSGSLFIDELDDAPWGLRYKALSLGEWRLRRNHQNIVIGGIRCWSLTAFQAQLQFGRAWLTEAMRNALDKNDHHSRFIFLHRIWPRADYDDRRMDAKGKKFGSVVVNMDQKVFMRPEGGYRTMPISSSTWDQSAEEEIGRGPAGLVLPTLKTLNAMKTDHLKAAHMAADPAFLTGDDGIVDFSKRGGALNKGGVNKDGKKMVYTLEGGNVQISDETMDREAAIIADAFLLNLFQIIVEAGAKSHVTAAAIMERATEKGILLAPTVGKQGGEYQGPSVERELEVLSWQGRLPPVPPVMREANGTWQYQVKWTSPIAKQARSQHAAGFIRSLETAQQVAGATGDNSVFDTFNLDKGMRLVADVQNVPEEVLASEDEMAQKRQARAAQQQAAMQIEAAPAQAKLIEATAKARAAGGEPQGAV